MYASRLLSLEKMMREDNEVVFSSRNVRDGNEHNKAISNEIDYTNLLQDC